MLALAISFVFALYVLGPDAFSRFILDFSVPRRSISLTKSEEVYRAVIWGSLALSGAYLWERWTGVASRSWNWDQLKTLFSGLYSEQFFRENRDKWFQSLTKVAWMNWCLLWRLYTVVLVLSIGLCIAIRYYAFLRHVLAGDKWYLRFSRNVLAAVILPRVAPWHLLLSRMYVRQSDVHIHLDVLTKMNILYQGRYEEKSLASDGSLVSLTLADPRRFRREDYIEDKRKDVKPDATLYWKSIPNNIFVLMGTDIHSINIRYVPAVSALKRGPQSDKLAVQLAALRDAVQALRASSGTVHVQLLGSQPTEGEERGNKEG